MTTSSDIARGGVTPVRPPTAPRAVISAWLFTATWDFVCASALNVFAYHSTFTRLWQGVASTLIGPAAFDMGVAGVLAGLVLHLAVALVWTTLFVLAMAISPTLRRFVAQPAGAIAVACAYGPLIWFVMSLGVIPFATGRAATLTFRWWVQVFAHVPFVTLPLVFAVRRAFGRHQAAAME